ncbi:Uncharacterised protein [Mycobacterium tuberculosis]|nr:Uncharacterised protein [Mycobacterium tuberculosis]
MSKAWEIVSRTVYILCSVERIYLKPAIYIIVVGKVGERHFLESYFSSEL